LGAECFVTEFYEKITHSILENKIVIIFNIKVIIGYYIMS
jgi:hypothetical protein